MTKPRVHIRTLSGCEGCQDRLEHSDAFVPLMGAIDLVECRLLTSPIDQTVLPGDIVIFEGAPITKHNVQELEEVRKVPGVIIIEMGTCAAAGGVQGNIPKSAIEEVKEGKWGDYNATLDLRPGEPVSHYIPVDAKIPGCPIDPDVFVNVIVKLLAGAKPQKFDYAMCAECGRAGCLLEKGPSLSLLPVCFGMIVAAGCGGLCPMINRGCLACQGFLPNANIEDFIKMLVGKGFSEQDVRRKLDFYNASAMREKEGGHV